MKETNKIVFTSKEVRDIFCKHLQINFGRTLPVEILISIENGTLQIEYTSDVVAPAPESQSWNHR